MIDRGDDNSTLWPRTAAYTHCVYTINLSFLSVISLTGCEHIQGLAYIILYLLSTEQYKFPIILLPSVIVTK